MPAKLRVGDRRRRAAELRERGWSYRRIAAELGTSTRTVARDLEALQTGASGQTLGLDGKSYIATRQRAAPEPVEKPASTASADPALEQRDYLRTLLEAAKQAEARRRAEVDDLGALAHAEAAVKLGTRLMNLEMFLRARDISRGD